MKNKMIGIIGGVGPQATQILYQKMIQLSQKKYNAEHNSDFPRIIIDSVPIPDFISNTESMGIAEKMLNRSVENLLKINVDVVAIGSNTVHLLFDKLAKDQPNKFVSMIDSVVQKIMMEKPKKVGILGSPVTISSGLYSNRFIESDVEVVLPTKDEIEVSNKIIRNVLAGKFSKNDIQKYISILDRFIDIGTDKIILGCTELPLAINYEALGSRVVNSIEVLAEDLVDYYYS